jgi:hypothetical protein
MPAFSSLRVWGRLNIILLPILAWLLSLSLNHFETLISNSGEKIRNFYKNYQPILSLILIYLIVISAQLYLHLNEIYDTEWKDYFQEVWPYKIWFIYLGIVAFAVVFSILVISRKYALESSKILTAIVFLLTAIAVCEMWPVGTHTWTYKDKPLNYRMKLDVDAINRRSFDFPRTTYRNTIFLMPAFNVGVVPSWYFDRYVKFLNKYADDLQAQKVLLGVIGKQRVFFSEFIDYQTVRDFLRDALRYKNSGLLLSYTGDKLEWQINAPTSGYVSFIDNWDSNWKVFVDSKEQQIELLFGTFKSVAVKKGQHHIKFVYKPGLIYK